ncbi:MAG: hypothetical protein NVS1B7_2750 [Candidatus Saccharimonadales bacterium]
MKKRNFRHVISRKKDAIKQALPSNAALINSNVPRITNETVAAHREEVIGKARKYKYPLQHSKHKIVVISATLFIVGIISFFSYCTIALYKLQTTSTFIYHVTQVVPFPIARANNRFVSYESYLFELRHYTHYYENHAKEGFTVQQLEAFKKTALDKVISNAYVKDLAAQKHIAVSDKEVNNQIDIVRSQNRLGNSDKVLEDVLKDYWGWSLDDFKRSLRQELLAQKVVSALDTVNHNRAAAALAEINIGTDFGAVAQKYSDDVTKDTGGDYGRPIGRSDRDLPAQVTEALFKLPKNGHSDIINTGYTLEIVKNIEPQGDKIHAAHVMIKLNEINTYIKGLKDKQKAKIYLKL